MVDRPEAMASEASDRLSPPVIGTVPGFEYIASPITPVFLQDGLTARNGDLQLLLMGQGKRVKHGGAQGIKVGCASIEIEQHRRKLFDETMYLRQELAQTQQTLAIEQSNFVEQRKAYDSLVTTLLQDKDALRDLLREASEQKRILQEEKVRGEDLVRQTAEQVTDLTHALLVAHQASCSDEAYGGCRASFTRLQEEHQRLRTHHTALMQSVNQQQNVGSSSPLPTLLPK